jgi:uncharacterized protein (TIGR03435 family)
MRPMILAVAVFQIARCFAQTPVQTQAPPPAFEVAAVKVSKEPPGSDASKSTTGSLWMRNMTLRAIAAEAYGMREAQVVGGPKWLDDERFDIDAKSAGPTQGNGLWLMLQTLLAERFQFAVHRENRTVSGYALVVTKGGLKMQPVEPGKLGMRTNNGKMTATKASMTDLAKNLSRRYAVEVSDATGVNAVFDFQADLPEPERRASRQGSAEPSMEPTDPAASMAALARALEDQLGLKLQGTKVLVGILVIDKAEKPVEN